MGRTGEAQDCGWGRRLAGLILGLGRAGCLLLLAALPLPLLVSVWVSFAPGQVLEPPTDRWSLRWYAAFFGSAKWTVALWTTVEVAALSVVGSLAGGLGLAVAVARYHFRGRAVLSGAVLLPLCVPGVVLGMGWLPLVMTAGLRGTVVVLAAAHCLISLPVVFLLLRSALAEISPDLERAARGLGAGPWTAFRRVTLPLLAPSLLAGVVVACVLSVNEFAVAVFLGTPLCRTLPAALWPESKYQETPLLAAASCLSVLVTLAGLWPVARRLRW